MIHAYDKLYLDRARTTLGRMLDFAVYDLGHDLEVFWEMFLTSGIAERFGSGDFTLLVGMSGAIPIANVRDMYWPFHEMDILQFRDEMNRRYRKARPDTNLKYWRNRAGLSQRELAEGSGVPLRTLQQYEQRQKNINRARVDYLVVLARTLGCRVEMLLEYVEKE